MLGAGCLAVARAAYDPAPLRLDAGISAAGLGALQMQLNGAVIAPGSSAPALLATEFGLGKRTSPLSYRASYSMLPGDVVTALGTDISRAPTGIARRVARHQISVHAPKFAGAPLQLDLTTEASGQWTTSGYRTGERERAQLKWSASIAELSLEWDGEGAPRDHALALDCDVKGSLRFPMANAASGAKRGFTLSGRDCLVRAASTPFDRLEARYVGVGYAWRPAGQQNELRLALIDPGAVTGALDYGAGYELGIRHTRQAGSWRASAQAMLRQPALQSAAVRTRSGAVHADSFWAADTSLAREFEHLSLSASWMHGNDPLWFVQDGGTRTDRFALALDLSEWASQWLEHFNPRMAMSWKWSKVERRQLRTSSNEVALNFEMDW